MWARGPVWTAAKSLAPTGIRSPDRPARRKEQYPEKKVVGKPPLQYLNQVARNTAADSYTAMQRVAWNDLGWKAANQSKD